MAFNFFQKFSQKKGLPKASVGKIEKGLRREKINEKKEVVEKEPREKMAIKLRPHEKNIFASTYLVSPHISEKAARLQEFSNKNIGASHTIRVMSGATKQLIKKAIQDRYDVKVDSVRIINTPDKKIRRGKVMGRKSGYKKAVVTLRAGNTIEQL